MGLLDEVPPGELDAYLLANSGLPGPRANLTLAQAAADVADEKRLRRWLTEPGDYLPLCGAIGIGRLIAAGRDDLWPLLKATANDDRWRAREGVAMGLQRVEPRTLLAKVRTWVDGTPLERRAAVAGVCEPRLLKDPVVAAGAVELVDAVTRTGIEDRTLRQALGYCWSVAVAADPEHGVPAFLALAARDDSDAQWIVRENRKKKRLPAACR